PEAPQSGARPWQSGGRPRAPAARPAGSGPVARRGTHYGTDALPDRVGRRAQIHDAGPRRVAREKRNVALLPEGLSRPTRRRDLSGFTLIVREGRQRTAAFFCG